MAVLRFDIQVSIPESKSGIRILGTKDEDGKEVGGIVLPIEVIETIREIRPGIQALKKYARKINEGQSNEENTVRAIYRICYHDEGEGHRQDSPEVEI